MSYHTSIEQQLSKIESEDKGRPRKKILILGAGMAGLAAGYELAQRGHQVKIIEGSSRLGGRVWTYDFKNGQHGELGAMRIPASHDYTRYYIKQCNLTLRPFINTSSETFRDFDGALCKAKDAPQKINGLFDLSQRDRDAIIKNDDHDAIYLRIMQNVLSLLSDAEKAQLFGHGPLSDKLNRLDQSLLKTLRQYADTDDAVRLMGKATVLDDYWHRSTLLFIREEIEEAFVDLDEIQGGMECLPKALADKQLPDGKTLRNHISFCKEVCSIEHGNEGVTITFKQDEDTETFPYVLCTIPFSVLRRIDIKGLSGSKKIKDAIQGLSYHSSTKVLVNCKQRFWELQDKIYGGASLTDSIARMTFYPSDNAQDKNKEISNGPGILLGSYTWGADAQRLGGLKPEDRGELVVNKVERFHPQIKNYIDIDLEERYKSMAWDQYPFASGAFSSPNPNDLQIFFPEASQPAGRLFFAGEHLSPYPTWIQGGLWSALQAVMQIVLA